MKLLRSQNIILQSIANSNDNVDDLSEVLNLDNFIFAGDPYRFLAAGTIREIEDNRSVNIVLETWIKSKPAQSFIIYPDRILDSINSNFLDQETEFNESDWTITLTFNTKFAIYHRNTNKLLYEQNIEGNITNGLTVHCNLIYLMDALKFFKGSDLRIGFAGKYDTILFSTSGMFGSAFNDKFGLLFPIKIMN